MAARASRWLGSRPAPAELTAAEWMSVDELRAVQLDRLRWTLRHAYENVPFYRRRFDEAGLHPDDCRELADLDRFPLTAKNDLRDCYPDKLFAVPRDQLRRIHASSGTTGKPTVAGYTRDDLDTWAGVMARSIFAAGGRPGDLAHIAYGYGLFTGGLGAHYGAERLGCAVIPASGGMTARQVELITALRPRIIMVTPSYLLTLLDEFGRAGLDPAASSLEVGILGAEPWTEAMRTEIETRAGLHAVDIYGLSEITGPGVAQECVETKDGLHVWEDHFFPEVIDPGTGAVLGEGSPGELVLTTLTKQAMPLIRYRTRDRTTLRPGTARPAFRRMDKVTGRTDDMLIIRGVNVFPSQIEEIVLGTAGLSPHFQLRLTRRNQLDQLTILTEAREMGDSSWDAIAAELAARVKDSAGVTAAVEISGPGSLERSAGKYRRVLDERRAAG